MGVKRKSFVTWNFFLWRSSGPPTLHRLKSRNKLKQLRLFSTIKNFGSLKLGVGWETKSRKVEFSKVIILWRSRVPASDYSEGGCRGHHRQRGCQNPENPSWLGGIHFDRRLAPRVKRPHHHHHRVRNPDQACAVSSAAKVRKVFLVGGLERYHCIEQVWTNASGEQSICHSVNETQFCFTQLSRLIWV